MSKIITDYKKIDLQKTAILIILRDGTINALPKIEGFDYHAEYLKVLMKNNKSIREITSAVNMDYYLKNPSEIISDVYPLFSLEEATIFINLAPNVKMPTQEFLGLFPEKVPKSTKNILSKMNKQLGKIEFFEVGKYNSEIDFYEIYEEYEPIKGDDIKIVEIMNDNLNNFNSNQKNR